MTTLPQARGNNTFVTGMRMYALATLKTTKTHSQRSLLKQTLQESVFLPAIAQITGGVPAIRSYAATAGLDPVIARSMLVARGWYDRYGKQTTDYAASMISDIINYRYGVNDATTVFIGRLRDLYAKKILSV